MHQVKHPEGLARMPEQGQHLVYQFGGWELDLARRELRARGVPVPLGSRAFAIFAVLVQSAGKLVTKEELMARVWPGVIVEENTLEVHISAVRKALGPDRGTLRTSFGRGYRLVGDWTIWKEITPTDSVAVDPTQIPVQLFQTNLPAATSEVIGRTAAVQHLQEFLSAHRAVTLTGPGGIGKTTLALEVARSLLPTFSGDCWLVDVLSLSDPGLVPSMVAGVLGLKLGSDEISPDSCRLWDIKSNDKLDKDRFRRDLGGLLEAYTEVARRLGIMSEGERPQGSGPILVKG